MLVRESYQQQTPSCAAGLQNAAFCHAMSRGKVFWERTTTVRKGGRTDMEVGTEKRRGKVNGTGHAEECPPCLFQKFA